jgi:hypothetical protein
MGPMGPMELMVKSFIFRVKLTTFNHHKIVSPRKVKVTRLLTAFLLKNMHILHVMVNFVLPYNQKRKKFFMRLYKFSSGPMLMPAGMTGCVGKFMFFFICIIR